MNTPVGGDGNLSWLKSGFLAWNKDKVWQHQTSVLSDQRRRG